MSTASQQLAGFAISLRLTDVPPEVLQRAKVCMADTVACAVFGAQLPWSQTMTAYATRYGAGGPCGVFGRASPRLQAPLAALANGNSVHAFEQDSLRFPGAGVHPGAALVPTIAAACQDAGADGATALRAFVAGCEVLFRIGAASHHSSEKLGFHAPGLTGVYGAAVAASVVYGLSAEETAHAMGIAGSMSAGLLAFTRSQQGAMVKRLHMGRACEAGISAARLAQGGFTGPETVLEGRFGYLEVFCREAEPALLTRGLGQDWETLKICLKRYACHVTAQAPVQALRELMHIHGFNGDQVQHLELDCNDKVISHHDLRDPQDVMQAQYSVPFCLAMALFHDPQDPAAFNDAALADSRIRSACAAVRLAPAADLPSAWSARLRVVLKDGRQWQQEAKAFKGMPGDALTAREERQRFELLCAYLPVTQTSQLYERLSAIELQDSFPQADIA